MKTKNPNGPAKVSPSADEVRKPAKLKPTSPKVSKNWKNNLFEEDDEDIPSYKEKVHIHDFYEDVDTEIPDEDDVDEDDFDEEGRLIKIEEIEVDEEEDEEEN